MSDQNDKYRLHPTQKKKQLYEIIQISWLSIVFDINIYKNVSISFIDDGEANTDANYCFDLLPICLIVDACQVYKMFGPYLVNTTHINTEKKIINHTMYYSTIA